MNVVRTEGRVSVTVGQVNLVALLPKWRRWKPRPRRSIVQGKIGVGYKEGMVGTAIRSNFYFLNVSATRTWPR